MQQVIVQVTTSTLEEAFRLVGLPDNHMIRKGQNFLQAAKWRQNTPRILFEYLESNHPTQNKTRAALLLRQCYQLSSPEVSHTFRTSALSTYLSCDDVIANILIQTFKIHQGGDQLKMQLVQQIESTHTGKTLDQKNQIRVRCLKLFKTLILNQDIQQEDFGQKYVAYKNVSLSWVSKFVDTDSEEAKNSSDLLKYRAINLFCTVIVTDIRSLTQQQFGKVIKILTAVLDTPEPVVPQKYSFKIRFRSMQCILTLAKFNQDQLPQITELTNHIWSHYIHKKEYAQYCMQFFTTLLQCGYFTFMFNNDQALIDQAVQRVIIEIMKYTYEEQTFYYKLDDNQQDFLDSYFLFQEPQPLRLKAINCLKAVIKNQFNSWASIVQAGAVDPNISNSLLAFMCDSHGRFAKWAGQESMKVLIDNVYQNSIQPHFFTIYDRLTMPNFWMERQEKIKLVCQIRFAYYFFTRLKANDMELVARFCSKLSSKETTLSAVCYTFIKRYIIQTLRKKKQKHPVNKLATIFHEISQDMIGAQTDVTLDHLSIIQQMVVTLRQYPEQLISLQKQIKRIINFFIGFAPKNQNYQFLKVLFHMMEIYITQFRFQPDFQEIVVKTVEQRMLTTHLLKCYIQFITSSGSDLRSAAELYREMCLPQFWIDHKDDTKLNASLFALISKLLPNSQSRNLETVEILLRILHNLQTNKQQIPNSTDISLGIIQMVFFQLQDVIKQLGYVDQFYWLVIKDRDMVRKKEVLLGQMIIVAEPTSHDTIVGIIAFMSGKRIYITDQNVRGCMYILFRLFQKVLGEPQIIPGKANLKLWGNILNSVSVYIKRQKVEELRVEFSQLFHDFVQRNSVDVARYISQKFQISLSHLLTNGFT